MYIHETMTVWVDESVWIFALFLLLGLCAAVIDVTWNSWSTSQATRRVETYRASATSFVLPNGADLVAAQREVDAVGRRTPIPMRYLEMSAAAPESFPCDCDLRHRRWNPLTRMCETCRRRYVGVW